MKVTVLMEDSSAGSPALISEHGLSLYLEVEDKRVLFDSGKTGGFIKNAESLGIDLSNVDMIILSHGHSDHGGGLLSLLEINDKAKIYMKRGAFADFKWKCLCFCEDVSLNKKIVEKYADRIVYVDDDIEISKDIFLVSKIARTVEIPKGNKYLFVKEKDKLIHDDFSHELVLVVKEKDGINILSGCSHNGVVNIIKTVRSTFTKCKIKSLIGGFHLMRFPFFEFYPPSNKEVDLIIKEITKENIEKIYTGHCTGILGFRALKKVLGDKIHQLRLGSVIEV